MLLKGESDFDRGRKERGRMTGKYQHLAERIYDMGAGTKGKPGPDKPKRKVIQIARGQVSLTALCNDGTIWVQNATSKSWMRVEDIPQG